MFQNRKQTGACMLVFWHVPSIRWICGDQPVISRRNNTMCHQNQASVSSSACHFGETMQRKTKSSAPVLTIYWTVSGGIRTI